MNELIRNVNSCKYLFLFLFECVFFIISEEMILGKANDSTTPYGNTNNKNEN